MNMKEQDIVKLNKLNKRVEEAIKERSEWLDSKMPEYAKVQVGEDIYDLKFGVKLGVVSEHYRYWKDMGEDVRDNYLEINYEYNTGGNCYDNTSRGHVLVGTKDDLIKYKEAELVLLFSKKALNKQ